MSVKDSAAAGASSERAARLSPKSVPYGLNLGRAYLLAGQPDKAETALDEAVALEPDNFVALTRAATKALAAGNYDAGKRYVDRMAKLQPQSPATLALQGDIAMRASEFSKALSLYERASVQAPSNVLTVSQFAAAKRARSQDLSRVLN